ncbi:MAG: PIN domain-containing protein [Brasilonema sp.]
MPASFIDTNIWLYRLFDDRRIEDTERERKQTIAVSLTESSNPLISTQVINEVSANLLKKAKFDEERLKLVIQSLYNRCQVVEFNLKILENASNLRTQYYLSFWDSLIVASALSAGASILYSEDMQDGLIVANQLTLINPFK